MKIHKIYLLLEEHVKLYGGTAAAVDTDFIQALKKSFSKNNKTLLGPLITLQQSPGGETWLIVRGIMNKLINQELSSISATPPYLANNARGQGQPALAFEARGNNSTPMEDARGRGRGDERRKRDRSQSRSRSRGSQAAGSTPTSILRGGDTNWLGKKKTQPMYKNVSFVNIKQQGEKKEVKIKLCTEESPTLSDSGTNIHVISQSTAKMLIRNGFRYYQRRAANIKEDIVTVRHHCGSQTLMLQNWFF